MLFYFMTGSDLLGVPWTPQIADDFSIVWPTFWSETDNIWLLLKLWYVRHQDWQNVSFFLHFFHKRIVFNIQRDDILSF